MRELTVWQSQVLDMISGYIDANGFSPSHHEIREWLGATSVNAARYHILELRHKGHIQYDRRARSIRLTQQALKHQAQKKPG